MISSCALVALSQDCAPFSSCEPAVAHFQDSPIAVFGLAAAPDWTARTLRAYSEGNGSHLACRNIHYTTDVFVRPAWIPDSSASLLLPVLSHMHPLVLDHFTRPLDGLPYGTHVTSFNTTIVFCDLLFNDIVHDGGKMSHPSFVKGQHDTNNTLVRMWMVPSDLLLTYRPTTSRRTPGHGRVTEYPGSHAPTDEDEGSDVPDPLRMSESVVFEEEMGRRLRANIPVQLMQRRQSVTFTPRKMNFPVSDVPCHVFSHHVFIEGLHNGPIVEDPISIKCKESRSVWRPHPYSQGVSCAEITHAPEMYPKKKPPAYDYGVRPMFRVRGELGGFFNLTSSEQTAAILDAQMRNVYTDITSNGEGNWRYPTGARETGVLTFSVVEQAMEGGQERVRGTSSIPTPRVDHVSIFATRKDASIILLGTPDADFALLTRQADVTVSVRLHNVPTRIDMTAFESAFLCWKHSFAVRTTSVVSLLVDVRTGTVVDAVHTVFSLSDTFVISNTSSMLLSPRAAVKKLAPHRLNAAKLPLLRITYRNDDSTTIAAVYG